MAQSGWYSSGSDGIRSHGFSKDKIYISDGGLASTLSGIVPDERIISDSPLWSSGLLHTDPISVKKAHKAFLRAGSTIITTDTYQSSPEMFEKHLDLADPKVDSLRLYGTSVHLADEAIAEVLGTSTGYKKALVVGSVGPYDACLGDGSEYSGGYIDRVSVKELEEWHFERIKRLLLAGVDLLAVETIPSVVEALGTNWMQMLTEFNI